MMKFVKNKQQLLFIFVFLLLLGSGIFVYSGVQAEKKQQERMKVIQELAQIQENKDQQIIDDEKEKIRANLLQRQSGLEEAIQDVIEKDSSATLMGLSSSTNQLELLTKLYSATQDSSLLPALFQISLDLRKFDEALQYLEILQATEGYGNTVDVHKYLYALFNSVEIDFATLGRFKNVVQQYADGGLITQEELTFYFSLITISRGDIDAYEGFMNQLRVGGYSERSELYQNAKKRYGSFVDTPEYYLKALLGIGLFQQGRYRPVEHISRLIIEEDPTYVLAYQLNAYSAIMLGNRQEAQKSLEYLRTNDEPNKELYLYLSGIVLYKNDRVNESILAFKQIKTEKNNIDVLRYQFLAYSTLNDEKGVIESIQSLSRSQGLTAYDYYTIFDLLFYQEDSSRYLVPLEQELASLLNSCYAQVTQDFVYVCLFGKAGINQSLGNLEKAYQFLTHASQRFPDRDIYERLGDLAQELDKVQEATKRYIKAITSTSVIDEQDGLRDKIRGLME